MSAHIRQVVQSKEAERQRLRELPWLKKLEMLEKLRDRQLSRGKREPPRKRYYVEQGELLYAAAGWLYPFDTEEARRLGWEGAPDE